MIATCPNCNLQVTTRQGLDVHCLCGLKYRATDDAVEVIGNTCGAIFTDKPGTRIRRHLRGKEILLDCGRKEARMNAWGTEKCIDRIDQITNWVKWPRHQRSNLYSELLEALIENPRKYRSSVITDRGAVHPRSSTPSLPLVEWSTQETDAVVVSATDDKMIRGAYLLAFSTLACNDVDVVVYDLGIEETESQPLKQHMEAWGVEFRKPRELYGKGLDGWQTWNKPAYIAEQLAEGRAVQWIDADASVGRPLTELFDFTLAEMLIVDHGWFSVCAHNRPGIRDYLGPHQYWSGKHNPCAGVCGFRGERDLEFVRRWRDLCQRACEDAGLRQQVVLYDQGALSAMLALDGYDRIMPGESYNDLRGNRVGPPQDWADAVFGMGSHIMHFGGLCKPWQVWTDSVYQFPHPHSIRREHDNFVRPQDRSRYATEDRQ